MPGRHLLQRYAAGGTLWLRHGPRMHSRPGLLPRDVNCVAGLSLHSAHAGLWILRPSDAPRRSWPTHATGCDGPDRDGRLAYPGQTKPSSASPRPGARLVTLVRAATIAQLLAIVACGGLVEDSSASSDARGDAALDSQVDASLDLGPYGGDAWWNNWDAPVFDVPPSIGMYPPNGDGPCDVTGCAMPFSVCLPAQGWCCGGSVGGRFPCTCGATLGCLPPYVCCPFPESEPRSCKLESECKR